jgi:hypothetical protein
VQRVIAVAIVFSTIGCYRMLRQNKRILSKRTKELYQRLVNALLIDVGICFLLVALPFGTCYIFVAAKSPYSPIVYSCAFTTATLYQVVAHLVLLIYITPYRRAVVDIYTRATRRSVQDSNGNYSSSSTTRTRRLFGPRPSFR